MPEARPDNIYSLVLPTWLSGWCGARIFPEVEAHVSEMVEALRPPPGRELRFVQFNGWTSQSGPEIGLSKLIAKEPPRILHRPLPEGHERVSAALRLVWHEPAAERETVRKP